jgi:two-component system, cell cycle sensor histidine kinase and response regulator CckA
MAKKILFVDGDEAMARMVSSMLEEMGYQVKLVTSGMNALDIFFNDPSQFDLVVTDQGMPDMSGLLLAKRLTRMRADIPVVLLTGLNDEFQTRARESGIRGFAAKPVNETNLAQAIENALKEESPSQH